MRYTNLILTTLIIFNIIGCKSSSESSSVTSEVEAIASEILVTKQQFKASDMEEGKLVPMSFNKHITVNGKIHLPNKSKVSVSTMMGGKLGVTDLVEGQWVRKGQQLFTITNPELLDMQRDYLVLQSKINYLQSEQERKRQLVNENLAGKQDLLLAQSDYQTNQAMYNTLGEKLKLYGVRPDEITPSNLKSTLSITSPLSGYIGNISGVRGQYITASSEVVSIDNPSHVHLVLNVLERDASLISKGQKIHFEVQGDAGQKHQAMVYLIHPSVNKDGMVNVHCHLEDSKDLLSGMYATAEIILRAYEVLAVPEESFVQIDRRDHLLVRIITDQEEIKYLPVIVDRGSTQDGYVEVLNTEDFTDKKLLVKGGYYLVN